VQLPSGRWISEKDPGYPFLAALFQAFDIIRLAPLFYGALGCLGLFFGARRWLGRFGGGAAVGLFCTSGAALLFAWRDYMPTFTDASLIAAGTGALLWAVLAAEATVRRRTWAGLAGFVALEAATFTRYTDIVVLGCAAVAVVVAWRLRKVPTAALAWWLGSVAAFGAGLAVFDDLVLCLHLDRQRLRHHLAVRPVLRPGDRRHRAARRLAAGPRAAPVLAGRGDIGGCRGRDVRAGPVVVRRHACQPGPPEGHGPDPAGSRRGKSAEWFQASAPAHGHPRDVRRSALAECRHSPLCRHHHRCKQAHGWRLEQPAPGVLIWRTPGGRSYTTTPTQYAI
jgi:hypothetical protein